MYSRQMYKVSRWGHRNNDLHHSYYSTKVAERYREVYEVLGATVRSLLETTSALTSQLDEADQAAQAQVRG